MKCEICRKEVKIHNSVVCGGKCIQIRQRLFDLEKKYFPTNGCDNCWGDLHQGCTEQCRKERGDSYKFGKDLWDLIHLIYPEKCNW